MKPKYTREIHATRLPGMLRAIKKTNNVCPASNHSSKEIQTIGDVINIKKYRFNGDFIDNARGEGTPWKNNPCFVCREFVGLSNKPTDDGEMCPCEVLGKEECLKRTRESLKNG